MLQILFVPWLIDLTWLMIDWLIDVVEHWDYAFNVWGRRQCGWGGWMRCCHSWWWRFALLPVSSFRQPMIMFDCFVGLYKWCCVGESKNYKSVWIQCEKGQPRSSSKLNKKKREKRVNPRIQKKERIAMTAIYNDIHTTSLCLCSIISICTVLVIGPDGVTWRWARDHLVIRRRRLLLVVVVHRSIITRVSAFSVVMT